MEDAAFFAQDTFYDCYSLEEEHSVSLMSTLKDYEVEASSGSEDNMNESCNSCVFIGIYLLLKASMLGSYLLDIYHCAFFWLFYVSIIFWESILFVKSNLYYFVQTIAWKWKWSQLYRLFDPPPTIISSQLSPKKYWKSSRRMSRKRKIVPIYNFPRRWMVLSCYMLIHGGARSLHIFLPIQGVLMNGFASASSPLVNTYNRVSLVSSIVEMTPMTLYDYHCLQWYGLFCPNRSTWRDGDTNATSQVNASSFGLYEEEDISNTIQIFVKSLSGRTLIFEVELSNLVLDVMLMIQHKEGICVDEQYLTFQGKILQESRILRDYNIQDKSSLHLSIRLKGGAGENISKCDDSAILTNQGSEVEVSAFVNQSVCNTVEFSGFRNQTVEASTFGNDQVEVSAFGNSQVEIIADNEQVEVSFLGKDEQLELTGFGGNEHVEVSAIDLNNSLDNEAEKYSMSAEFDFGLCKPCNEDEEVQSIESFPCQSGNEVRHYIYVKNYYFVHHI